MRKFLLAGLVSLCALAALPARAEGNPNLVAAYQLFDSLDMKGSLDDSMNRLLQLQLQQNPALLPYREVMQTFFRKYLGYDNLRDDLAGIYAEEFSEAELRDIAQFYSTPTGQKALKKMPLLLEKGSRLGAQRVQSHLPELKSMVEAEARRIQALQAK